MLKGLEISVLNLSETLEDNKTKRFDSEYFRKEYLKIDNNISSNKYKRLMVLCEKITDFGAFSQNNFIEYKEEGSHYFIRNQDIENSFITDEKIYIEKDAYEKLSLKLNEFDLLLQRTGSIGKSGLVLKKDLPSSANQNLAQIKPDLTKINPYFLNVYLNSLIGQKIFERLATGNVQPWLNLGQIESIKVPSLSENIQIKIEKLVKESYNSLNTSKQTYSKAENLLLDEIGLQNFTPSKEPVNVKSFKDSFATSGRLDAEYYQPKYDDYLELIESYSNGSEDISTICNLNGKNYKPEDKNQYKYIELSNVGKTGDINGCTVNYGKELPSRARRKVNTGDVIISSIEGSLQSCALVTKEYNNALCSTGFYVINSDLINSESLLVLFKSELMQNILKQNCSGTILTGLNKDDFLNIRIPKIIETKQQQIANLIEQSFALKKQSENLLEVAKRAVEIAIEENEEVAIAYINKQSNSNG